MATLKLTHPSHDELQAYFNMKRSTSIGHNTNVVVLEHGYGVKLHRTVVFAWVSPTTFRLDSGGWMTPTTKDRINQMLPFGYAVYQHKRAWWLSLPDGRDVSFIDGMEVNAVTGWVTL